MKEKILIVFFIFLLLFSSGCLTQETGKEISIREKAIVTEVSDGDTITIQGGIRVRLLGIDAPDRGELYYEEAKEWLKEKILFKEIELEKDKTNKDQYGRLLRWIWLNNSLINEEIVLEGLAIAKFFEENERYQKRIQEAEKEAMNNRKGLWKQLSGKNETDAKTKVTIDSCVLLGCPEGTSYVGSKNSKKVHKCECAWAKKIKKENLVCFKTKEEAINKGYTPCVTCKP